MEYRRGPIASCVPPIKARLAVFSQTTTVDPSYLGEIFSRAPEKAGRPPAFVSLTRLRTRASRRTARYPASHLAVPAGCAAAKNPFPWSPASAHRLLLQRSMFRSRVAKTDGDR